MPNQPSISRLLTVWLSGGLLVFWLIAVGLGVYVMQDEFGEIFDSSLQETAERLAPLVVDDLFLRDDNTATRQLESLYGTMPDEYLTYQVRDASGRVLLHSHNVAADPYPAPLKAGFWEDEHRRIYTVSAVSGTVFVQVADSLDHRKEAATEGGFALLLPGLLLLPLSVLAVIYIVKRAVRPVDQLRQAISSKDSGNLSEIELDRMPVELQPIMHSVNLLLTRLRGALEAERELTANSAHELRTPIAGALAQTQMLISELAQSPAQPRAMQVESALQKLATLNERLLQLARAEAGIGASGNAVDLAPILDLVVEEFDRRDSSGRLIYQRDAGLSLIKPANPDAFAIILRNLIENALLYGAADAPVHIEMGQGGAITIRNKASAMSDEELAHIRRRFVRGDNTKPGSGLGLAITERLLAQMNARLELSSITTEAGQSLFQAKIAF
ncbi:sensor histidine kinase [Rhizobium oryzicola]|uniref:histidine kinase n=1 Tax=Rhizobium oryzicola TaxID=1232668 RepID=A0ABT8SYX9_9HYPH|nr:sensor histidine kinase [Rhizobium oryzicola]MDO1583674.1 sensor histidine kinase [Rhizobium oryzicola]